MPMDCEFPDTARFDLLVDPKMAGRDTHENSLGSGNKRNIIQPLDMEDFIHW